MRSTARDLFGRESAKFTIDFPSHLANFLASLPPGHNYTAQRVIYGYTIFPFFSAFRPPDRVASLINKMCNADAGAKIHTSIGAANSSYQFEFLRYCPLCIKDKPGQAYWRRIDQIPGVLVCLEHSVFLENSTIHRHQGDREALVTATQAIKTLPAARPMDLSKREHEIHLRIAQDVRWILDNLSYGTDISSLGLRYLGLLMDRQLATCTGFVRLRQLLKEFLDFYPDNLLDELHAGFEVEHSWLSRIFDRRTTQYPIRHLLLMQFLGLTAEEFFHLPNKMPPFGTGPWPCLNRASNHYKEERITNCKIGSSRNACKIIVGTFSCDCGFIYRRDGPDTSLDSRYTYNRVLSYGPIWENRVLELCGDGILTHQEIAVLVGISRRHLNHKLTELRREKSCAGKESESGSTAVTLRTGKRRSLVKGNPQETHRLSWLSAYERNPGRSRCAIMKEAAVAYRWLLRHDKTWLDNNSPHPLTVKNTRLTGKWQKRDARLAKEAEDIKERMLSIEGHPVRVSRRAIISLLRISYQLPKNAELLPLTVRALERLSESPVDYTIRRVSWARDCIVKEGKSLSYFELIRRACVSSKIIRNPRVERAVREAL